MVLVTVAPRFELSTIFIRDCLFIAFPVLSLNPNTQSCTHAISVRRRDNSFLYGPRTHQTFISTSQKGSIISYIFFILLRYPLLLSFLFPSSFARSPLAQLRLRDKGITTIHCRLCDNCPPHADQRNTNTPVSYGRNGCVLWTPIMQPCRAPLLTMSFGDSAATPNQMQVRQQSQFPPANACDNRKMSRWLDRCQESKLVANRFCAGRH